jgi:hypothetical protein
MDWTELDDEKMLIDPGVNSKRCVALYQRGGRQRVTEPYLILW